jgi:DNA-binding SARP family transcriptional activator/TolB-like protein
LTLPPSKKTRALLAYLALTGRPHRRERLCSLLWEVPDDPRGALRWSLSRLRSVVDEPGHQRILADRQQIAFEPAGCHVDFLTAKKMVANGLETVSVTQLKEMAEAFRGEFLEGLDLSSCDDFQAWCVAQREEAKSLQSKILSELVDRLASIPEEAAPHARTLAQLDPYDVPALIQLIRLLIATGRRDEAEQQFNAGRRNLEGLDPTGAGKLEAAWRELSARGAEPVPGRPSTPLAVKEVTEAVPIPQIDLPLPDKPSIALLPFANELGAPGQAYFTDGLVRELTTAIGGLRPLFVIAWASAATFRDQSHDMRRVAARLGVHYLLQGSVRNVSDRAIVINAQLGDGLDGSTLWARRFAGEPAESSRLLGDLIEVIARTIEPELSDLEIGRAKPKIPDNLEALELCRRGAWHGTRGSGEDLSEALRLFRRAIALDGDMAEAHAGLAEVICRNLMQGKVDNPGDYRKEALEAARKAVDIEPDSAGGRCALGEAHMTAHAHEAAASEFQTATGLNPNFTRAHYGLGTALIYAGRPREGPGHLEKAIRLSPLDPDSGLFFARMADAFLLMRQHEEAAAWARKAVAQSHHAWLGFAALISALGHLGRLDEARSALLDLLDLEAGFSLEFVRRNHLFPDQVTLDFVGETQLFTDQDHFAHYLDGLLKAGVAPGPEA